MKEIKVPAILVPGSGTYVVEAGSVYDVALEMAQSTINSLITTIAAYLGTDSDTDLSSILQDAVTSAISSYLSENSVTLVDSDGNAVLSEKIIVRDDDEVDEDATSVTQKTVADIATVAYNDEEGNNLHTLYEQVQTLESTVTTLKTKINSLIITA